MIVEITFLVCKNRFMNQRVIFHVDMDAFFASVEILKNPALKGKPVIVGGDPSKRGVVSTCSYEARKFGVRSAMSLFEAKRRCPHGIFIEGSYEIYGKYSAQVMDILAALAPKIEVVGIDEAYFDVTDEIDRYSSAFKLGQLMRQEVAKHTGLTCSVGIGSNKLIAKIASSTAKPNGLFEVPAGMEAQFLEPMAIEKIPGIGLKTQVLLNHDGIKTVGDLQRLGMEELINRYGAGGYYFYMAAFGRDDRPVETEDQAPKSVGAETTFEVDHSDSEFLRKELLYVFRKAYKRLRRHKMRTRGFSLKLRYSDFHTITRSHTFDTHLVDYERLIKEVIQLFDHIYDGKVPLRLIGVSFEKLSDGYWQPTFWDWLERDKGQKGR